MDASADFDTFYAQRSHTTGGQAEGPILVAAIDGKGIPMAKPEPAAKTVRLGEGELCEVQHNSPYAPSRAYVNIRLDVSRRTWSGR